MTRPLDTTKFPDLSEDALGFDPDALALRMWRYSNPYADPDPDVVLGRRQQSKAPARGRGQSKPRRPPLDTLLKQADKAGKNVKGAEVYPDRTVLQFGEPEPAEPKNPWPLDEFRTKANKQ